MPITTPVLWSESPCQLIRTLALSAALLTAVATDSAQAAVTDPFSAHFAVSRDTLALGTTTFTLEDGTTSGCYVYRGKASPSALVALFLGTITDESRFCIEDGTLRPRHFSHHVDGDRKKSYTLDFDWSATPSGFRYASSSRKATAAFSG